MKRLSFVLFLTSFNVFAKEENISVTPLTENVYLHTSYLTIPKWGNVPASGLVVVKGNDAYIIDTPWTNEQTKALLNWISSQNLVVKGAVVTHFHEDASGGLKTLNNSQIPTYAHSKTNQLLRNNNKESASQNIPTDLYELVSKTIEVYYPGKGHSSDNVVVWLPKDKVLFGGCFVKSLNSKSLGNLSDASVESWPNSIANLKKQYPQINIVVPGHGKFGTTALLEHTSDLANKKLSEKINN